MRWLALAVMVIVTLAILRLELRLGRLERDVKGPRPTFPDVCPGAGGRCKAPAGGVHDPHCAFGGRGTL